MRTNLSLAVACALFSCALVLSTNAADSAADPFTLAPGYSNARTATDPAKPQPALVPRELQSYTTLHSIGFEWNVEGDTDHDATCKVAYRRADEQAWHEALPLMRVDYFGWYLKGRTGDRPYNMFAGSIMFLRPSTEYVVRLTLADPDGGGGDKEIKVATRPIPDAGKPTRTLHVAPRKEGDTATGEGTAENPFRGIEVADKAAKPGDLLLVHAGDYGAVTFERSGEPAAEAVVGAQAKYIVWKAAGDGPAKFNRVYVSGSNVWFEGLAFERTQEETGLRSAERVANVVVRANTFRRFAYAVRLDPTSRGWYVADNDIIGDGEGGIRGEGVELNHSPDHTVCYNRITKTADGVSYCLRNCDIFANDIFDFSDDGVEPDYGYANNRIWGNRLDGPAGITFQPMYCGPWYIVRNQIISSVNAFKLRVQDRYVVTNNTFLLYDRSSIPHGHGLLTALMRNNLWIHAGGAQSLWTARVPQSDPDRETLRKGVLFDTLKADWRTDIDYDGFDWSALTVPKNGTPQTPFMWNAVRLLDLSALAAQVGIEQHGRTVSKEKIFDRYAAPPYESGPRPTFTLRADGEAVDAGAALANIGEEFAGKAPDLGVFEAGQPVLHVGPRMGDDWRKQHGEWVLKHQR